MILVDSNVIMYAAGAEHEHKAPSVSFLEEVGAGRVEAVVDAEVLQEILHRYRALRRWEDGRRVYDLTRRLFPVVVPITDAVLDRARALLDRYGGLMARDAVHAAVVQELGLAALVSYDRDVDVVRGVKRREPS